MASTTALRVAAVWLGALLLASSVRAQMCDSADSAPDCPMVSAAPIRPAVRLRHLKNRRGQLPARKGQGRARPLIPLTPHLPPLLLARRAPGWLSLDRLPLRARQHQRAQALAERAPERGVQPSGRVLCQWARVPPPPEPPALGAAPCPWLGLAAALSTSQPSAPPHTPHLAASSRHLRYATGLTVPSARSACSDIRNPPPTHAAQAWRRPRAHITKRPMPALH
jgi:hypothetical protein